MTAIAALWGARGLALIGALLIGLLGVKAWQLRERSIGAEKVVQASKEVAKKANATNADVRRRASEPGAAERLRRDACRDC